MLQDTRASAATTRMIVLAALRHGFAEFAYRSVEKLAAADAGAAFDRVSFESRG